ncbi:TPA: hypothetical protein ACKFG0_004800, partial [Klebsiella pneumoniae]
MSEALPQTGIIVFHGINLFEFFSELSRRTYSARSEVQTLANYLSSRNLSSFGCVRIQCAH